MYLQIDRQKEKKTELCARLENTFKDKRKQFNPRLEIYSNEGPTCHRCQNTEEKKGKKHKRCRL